MTNNTADRMKCQCRPLNDDLMYTGDCPIHQAKMEITIESLKKSSSPEAKAILALIEAHQKALLERVLEQGRDHTCNGMCDGQMVCIEKEAIKTLQEGL